MHSRASLHHDLRALGLAPGDTVMVHASVRAVGAVAGGPDQIHLAIKDAIGAEGTLLMYASCPGRTTTRWAAARSRPDVEAELLEKLPPFDARTARSARDNGALVEMLRTYPGSQRQRSRRAVRRLGRACRSSLRRAAVGLRARRAARRSSGSSRSTAGSCSSGRTTTGDLPPLRRARRDFPDKRVARYQVPVLERGERVWRWMEEFDTSDAGAHAHWPARFFARIVDGHLRATRNAGGRGGRRAELARRPRAARPRSSHHGSHRRGCGGGARSRRRS